MITKHTTMQELLQIPELAAMKGQYISSRVDYFAKDRIQLAPVSIQEMNPTWNADDMTYGLNRLEQIAKKNKTFVFSVYCEEEIRQNPALAQVTLIWMPADQKKMDTYAILTAGGAYGAVCTMGEAMPVAARLNELGMDCFCLNYRTAGEENFSNGLMPFPLDDLAAAICYIRDHEEELEVNWNQYVVSGFSAGGHLCAMWGTDHLGYLHYGLPKPQMLIPVYPLVTMENFPEGPLKDFMCKGLFGEGYTSGDLERYAVQRHIHSEYPRTYVVQCKDDQTVSAENSQLLVETIQKAGIDCQKEFGEKGGHGFGLGTVTDVAGWVDRALKYL